MVAMSYTVARATQDPHADHSQHQAGAHEHPEVQGLKNPLKGPEAIEAGKKTFAKYCASCHGAEAKGDGAAGKEMDPKPPNLTDATWKHGSTDGEIFTTIRNGTKEGMLSFKSKLTEKQVWEVVTFVRSLGPKAATH